MPTIRLAHWHGGNPPGSEVDVSVEDLALLKRDGRVAEVLPDKPEAVAEHAAAPAEEPVPEPAAAEAEAPAKSGRRRR